MNHIELAGVLAVILGFAPAPRADVGVLDAIASRHSQIANPWGNCTLPDSVMRQLGLSEAESEWPEAPFVRIRAARASLFGFTARPPAPVRSVAEFEPARELVLAYRYYDEYEEVFGALLASALDQGTIRVLVSRADRPRLLGLLARWEIPRHSVTIDTSVPFDTVWNRDWGPRAVVSSRGLELVDARYFLNCVRDDAAPTRLGSRVGARAVHRPDLWVEGGDLLSNGAGLCFATTSMIAQNGLPESVVAEQLRAYWGCEHTLFFEPLAGNVVRHIDMFLYPAAEDIVLLGRYELAQDPENSAILEDVADRLRVTRTLDGRPITVLRVPMPDHRPAADDDPDGPLIRSHLNMLAFNEVVMVPVFDDHRETERQALEIIQRAFPDRWLAPIAVDLMAEDNGTIHCITQTIPVVVQ